MQTHQISHRGIDLINFVHIQQRSSTPLNLEFFKSFSFELVVDNEKQKECINLDVIIQHRWNCGIYIRNVLAIYSFNYRNDRMKPFEECQK
jgi:hypothetical protein